jgi:hypothetical protein
VLVALVVVRGVDDRHLARACGLAGPESAQLLDDRVLLGGLADRVPHDAFWLEEVDPRVGDQDCRAVCVGFYVRHLGCLS